MWIRSQDRKLMVNLDNADKIWIYTAHKDGSDAYFMLCCDGVEVARYCSKDQAMVRLGQIQDNICNFTGVMQMPEDIES